MDENEFIPKKNSRMLRVDADFEEAVKMAAKELNWDGVKVTKEIGKSLKEKLHEGKIKAPKISFSFGNIFPLSKPKKKKKKGSIADVIVVIVFMLVIGLSFLVLKTVWNDLRPELTPSFFNTSAEGRGILAATDNFFNILDYLFLTVFVLSVIAFLYFSWSVEVPASFTWVVILLTMILVLVGAMFSNVYEEVSTGFDRDEFPIMNYIFEQFPIVVAIIGGLSTIVIFAKGRLEGI